MNDKRVLQGLFITSVLVLAALSITFATADGPGSTIHVYADGSGDYPTIQSAIENASTGDTIIVGDGIYNENIVVNKSVNIVGESKNAVIDSSGDVVNITARWVNISWLTLKNGSNGIAISSDNVTVSNCNISNNNIGVYLEQADNNMIVNTNSYNNSGDGFRLGESSFNHITGCNISGNPWRGILLNFSCKYNVIENCNITGNWNGIGIYQSFNNTVSLCNLTNQNSNIVLDEANNSIIKMCKIRGGSFGIKLPHLSSNNAIYHNDFINNIQNAYDVGSNIWDNGYPSGGNYWDDYTGSDTSPVDGIGDISYNIPGGSSSDRYPFVSAVDLIPPYTTCTVSGTLGDNGWYVGNVTVTLLPTDNESDINHTFYSIDNGLWITYSGPFGISSEGAHTLEYYSADTVGNKESKKSAIIKIDKSLPSIDCYLQPETPSGNDGWYNNNVEVTLSADDNASGVESIKYRIDQDTWKDYTGYFLLTVEGNHTFTFYASDYAGHEVTDSRDIKIDKTAPYVEISHPSGGYVEGIVEIEWNASDNVDSNLNGSIYIYAVSGSERIEIASGLDNDGTYAWNTLSFDDSSYRIEVVATDDAGNNGTNISQPFVLDNSPPTIKIDQPRGGEVLGSGKNLVIFWNASDDVDNDLDGTIWISYSHDGGSTWTDILKGVANSGKYTYGIDTWENGEYMLRINATDDAGNTGWAVSGNFTIDKTPPTVTIKKPESGYLYIFDRKIIPLPYNTVIIGKITVEISASDEFSNIDHIDINAGGAKTTLDGGNSSSYEFDWNTPLEKCNLNIVAYDMAGNSGEDELTDIFCINM